MMGPGKRKYVPAIGYSTNVHRGETLEQVYRFLEEYTVPIARRVFGEKKAGLELRLGIGSTQELLDPAARARFRDFLVERDLELFSINAFPLRDFHAMRVKEDVYLPSWRDEERGRVTARIAEVTADLLPEGVEASISTLGGCFRREAHDEAAFRRMAAVLLETLDTFLELERAGKRLTLAVEPEPETTFETTRDVVEFFERYLLPQAFDRWRKVGTREEIDAALRRLFSVNVDTCHLSVLFEDTVEGLRVLERAGIRVGKLHVTNAIALADPFESTESYDDLRAMHEPRYFHQVAGADAEGRVIWRELDLDRLPEKLVRGEHPDVVELRSHFHVPLFSTRHRSLSTTQNETVRAVRETVERRLTTHLVLETYTWPILVDGANADPEARRETLIDGIVREHEWLLGVLAEIE
ncbi:MAG TPA: metabolite traffic protein EboE, partial [Planctomycetota bacterium]|nr:metabolite traffic protein EboE [Planctomycetota bacterium]